MKLPGNMEKPKFVYVTYIDTTPEKLWKAITTASFIEQYWMGRQNTSDWKKGSVVESRSPEGELEWKGRVLESRRPRRLVYTFDPESMGEPASRVTFEIEKLRGRSHLRGSVLRLRVTHDQFPAGSKVYTAVSEGWPSILSSLKSLLETGRGLGLKWK
jgi:uncharacterized protein YndB with AHSA1/START domain